jgi:hypothetical protein
MSNIWKSFENLLPKKKQLIGTVAAVNTVDKTSTVTLLSGNNIIVSGEGTVGNIYLIEDGFIKEELPSLTTYTVTIY